MDPELLARLVDQHADRLVLYARQWCDTPDDVVQEAFLSLVRQPELPQELVGWLYRAVRNGAISAARSSQRRKRREQQVAAGRADWFAPDSAARLDAEAAREALAELPIDQREVIVAHLWGGLTFEQVAAVAGISASAAHRRYQAGLAQLRERLGAAWPTNASRNP